MIQGNIQKQAQSQVWSSNRRLRLTGIGGVALFCVSAFWVQDAWLSWIFYLGITLALGGLLLRMWATGWLVKNDTLTIAGPYRFTRNPLYLGTLLITLGQCLMSDVPWAPLFFAPLCLALYWPTMRQEEQYLRERYGADYASYAERVPLLLPNLGAFTKPETSSTTQTFEWRRVRRCYKGFFANALVILAYGLLHLAR